MKKVYVFLAEGFEEMEAVTPIDLLRRAGVDAKLVSVTGNRAVTGAHGVTYLADLLFEEIEEDADMLVLLKPLTYMNLSGQSVGAAAQFFKIPPQRVIVLCDDVDQAAGHMRIRPQGSAGGHNGLKDIIAHLGSQEFIRVRMGVGRKPRPDYDLADWVLGKPAAEDRKAIDARYPDAEAACRLLMAGKLAEAQNKYNH